MATKTKKIVENHDATTNLAYQTIRWKPADKGIITIACSGLEGTLDGKWTFYKVNKGVKSKVGEIVLDVADNSDDAHDAELYFAAEEIGFEYTANGVTGASALTSLIIHWNEA